MPNVLALDQGTTSSRAVLFDDQGNVVATAQREFTQHFPQPGWVEHDPEEIWATQFAVAEEAARGASDIAALGITNQRETTVVWDRATGEPIHNAIVWQDRRTADVCERIRSSGAEAMIRKRTGLLLDAYFSGTKIAWILDNVPGARLRAERGDLAFGTIDSWLAWKLSGGSLHITDASNASRTLLFDIHEQEWSDELLGALRVPRAVLPEVRDSSEGYGESVLGNIPIASLIGDQQAATAGQASFEAGLGKNTYGTGCFLLVNTGGEARVSDNGLLTTVAWRRGGETTYALEGSVFIGGAIVQWLRDGLGLIGSAAEVEALAGSVDDAGGVYLVPALAGLGAPHWDPHARGSLFGMTRGTTAGHIARAALEGIAFQVHDLVRAMEQDADEPFRELRVDGGAAVNDLLLQTQADLLRVPVERPTVLETTALGAAYMAGLATGVWSSTDAIAERRRVDRVFEPRMESGRAEEMIASWHEAVERSKGWAK
jgi:glycerol kinase